MKKLPAIIAAFVTTLVLACLMVAVVANALMNPNTVQAADTPGQVTGVSSANASGTNGSVSPVSDVTNNSAAAQAQIQQLQSLVAQYQARDKQYQDREQQLLSQINQLKQTAQNANSQAQQYQNILGQLQQMGVIRITQSGQIFVPSFSRNGFGDDH